MQQATNLPVRSGDATDVPEGTPMLNLMRDAVLSADLHILWGTRLTMSFYGTGSYSNFESSVSIDVPLGHMAEVEHLFKSRVGHTFTIVEFDLSAVESVCGPEVRVIHNATGEWFATGTESR